MKEITKLTIGIDATNLRRGGGVTHLVELLRAAKPATVGIERIVIWGSTPTLNALDNRPWLDKRSPPALDKNLIWRTLWQRYSLSQAVRDAACDILFVPGGNYAGNFRPVVTMSRNMLPFAWQELWRFGWSLMTVKLLMLRISQTSTFRRADGVIFLTSHAQREVREVTGELKGQLAIIPHGLNSRFTMKPRPQEDIDSYSADKPYRLLYVSIIDQYKHQWHLVQAVAQLREQTQWPLALDLVGPAYPPALKQLKASIRRFDPEGSWTNYHGAVPYSDLHQIYAQADLGVFASSCENMPNILLETMAAGLPVACSNRGPMPEILQDAGVYFDPEMPGEIARALKRLIISPELRAELAEASYAATKAFTWERCAADTLEFLAETVRRCQEAAPVCAD